MRTNYHDPDARAILHARKVERDNEWLRQEIGEATYLRSLMIMGIPLDEARIEFNSLSGATSTPPPHKLPHRKGERNERNDASM